MSEFLMAFGLAAIMLVLGFFHGAHTAYKLWKSEMVKSGYAEHNPQTGEWEWVDGKSHDVANY